MNLPRLLLTAAAGALALGLAAAPASATVARDGSVAQRANAQVGENENAFDANHAEWSGHIANLATSAHARRELGQNVVDAHSSIEALWDSADAGSISVTNHGWTTTGSDPGQLSANMGLNDAESGAPDWTYSFTAEGFGAFNFASRFIGGGDDDVGLGNWTLIFTDDTGSTQDVIPLHSFLTPQTDDSGFVARQLIDGHTYRAVLFSNEGRFIDGRGTNRVAAETARFDWNITGSGGTDAGGVPEPSTWALAITGFGLAGAALRRRRALSLA